MLPLLLTLILSPSLCMPPPPPCRHIACAEGAYSVAQWLMESGVDPNPRDRHDRTPLEVRGCSWTAGWDGVAGWVARAGCVENPAGLCLCEAWFAAHRGAAPAVWHRHWHSGEVVLLPNRAGLLLVLLSLYACWPLVSCAALHVLCCWPLYVSCIHVLQEAVRMDHLEVVKLMEQSGGKVWEDGNVSGERPAAAAAQVAQAAAAAGGQQDSGAAAEGPA